jgi:hypothetical protein
VWEGWGDLHGEATAGVGYPDDSPAPPGPPTSFRAAPVAPEIADGPKVRMPAFARSYLLFEGPLDAVGEVGVWIDWIPDDPTASPAQSTAVRREFSQYTPSLWWPDDHAWCVATEIDFEFTYVGGSFALIDELLTHPEFKVQPAPAE